MRLRSANPRRKYPAFWRVPFRAVRGHFRATGFYRTDAGAMEMFGPHPRSSQRWWVAQIADQAVPNHSAIEILDQTQDLS